MNFNLFVKKEYQKTEKYYNWITQTLFLRIIQWTKSLQFTQVMEIQPDYFIEISVLHLHFWLVINRLYQIGTKQSRYIASKLDDAINFSMELSTSSLHVKRKNTTYTNIYKMLTKNSDVLNTHFNYSNITANNHYLGIDSLVWSIVFTEKVDRYSDKVYLFAEYLIQNYEHLKRHTQQDLFNGIIEFDVFLIDPNYKRKIKAINPHLSAQELEKQMESNSTQKKYSYNYIQKNMELPIDAAKRQQEKVKLSFSNLLNPIFRIYRKYKYLSAFDHFNQMEKSKKQMDLKDKTTPWKTERDTIKSISKEFNEVQRVRKQRRKNAFNIKQRDDNNL